MKFLAHSSKLKALSSLLALSSSLLALSSFAQQTTRLGNLVVTGSAAFQGTLDLPANSLAISDTSGLQAALDAKQPLDSDLTSIAALTTTTFGRSLLTQADAAATRTTLGLGTAATTASTAYATAAQGTKADNAGAINGLLKSNGSASFSAATSGTDYVIPSGSVATLTTGRTLGITGDLVWTSPSFNGSANVTAAGTLATVNSNVGTFGSATQSLTATVNAKGLVTAMSAQTVTPAWTSVTGKPTTVATSGLTDAVSTSALDARIAAYIEREGLRFDGSAGATIGKSGIPATGTSAFTIIAEKEFGQPNGTWDAIIGGPVDGLVFGKGAANTLECGAINGVSGVGSETIASGDRGVYAATFDGTSVRFYINGRLSSTHTAAVNATAACDFIGASSAYSLRSIGVISRPQVWNYALTQAEIQALINRGLVSLPEQRGGSMTNKILSVSRNSDFSAGATDWAGINGGSASVVSSALNISRGGSAFGGASLGNSYTGLNVVTGRKYRVEVTITNYSSSGGVPTLAASGSVQFATSISGNGKATLEFTSTISEPLQLLIYDGSGAANFTLTADDVKITDLGTLFEMGSGQRNAGYQHKDTSGNLRDVTIPATGVAIIDPDPRGGNVRGSLSWSGTHEAKSLLGQIALPSNARVTNITTTATTASSGSGLTLGTTNSATRWVALNTYSTGTKIHTVANSGLPAGTAAADLDIVLDPDTANYTGTINVSVDYTFTN